MKKCNQCPRQCVSSGKFCNATNLKIAKVMKHFWEEPIISGKNGSGAIFFSNCNLKCVYCQNYEISSEGFGEEISVNKLVEIFKLIEKNNCCNINLVSPTQYSSQILSALKIYKPRIPVIWNCGGYESTEMIKALKDYVDIYLCDFKYYDEEKAIKYSKAKNYFKYCSEAIIQMRINQPKDIIKNGLMKKGLIVRHLILPNNINDSINILKWIKDNLGIKTYISLMCQYFPCYKSVNFPEINRRLKALEYKIVERKLYEFGFINGYTQGISSADSEYTPKFITKPVIDLE